MEIVYFVLGVVTVLLVLGIVVIVKMSESIKKLNIDNKTNVDVINSVERSLHERIDETVNRLNSKIDSRIDRLESDLKKKLSNKS
jgi:sensor histidine kinase YesM